MEVSKTQPPQEIEDLLNAKNPVPAAQDAHSEEVDYLENRASASGSKDAVVKNARDVFTEEKDFTYDQINTGIRLEYLRTLRQNNGERKKYARLIFLFTCLWAAMIFVILFLTGFKKVILSDTVLVALITTTTVNFFGFFLLVVKYLFNTGAISNDATAESKD
ncbi:hypothetical protein GA0116948_103165 [Chitinophaga costaii]|uniref:Uncharacterized protein n=1 Tax=Chitinophaga costaii TaxID=1335309 RepID=A0A1C4BMM6_9BACT|nr:hypothetical protein [Chitinophaga costaii]PUZ27552.1 hypothetical protein DCM91_04820 [Chitinophaga costaii]SCC07942.1 hypothetical protein GA0116948_103165 [Chitinophaga costaii]